MRRRKDDVRVHAFTRKFDQISSVLISFCYISGVETEEMPNDTPQSRALWDTGATSSCISREKAEEINLEPIGRTLLNGVLGSGYTNVYLINLLLTNGVRAKNLPVAEINVKTNPDEDEKFDVLVGMDVINQGDFAISNRGKETVFTFRMPSMERFDFVRDLKKSRKR
ncbi:MAG: aspartyl protease family protein [Gammaproteobacteria bacterium]|nr:aspartyl protease family protein [Gammaproteobacteria bacterium]